MILSIVNRFLNQKSSRISSAAITVAVFGLISRIFGLWRDRLLAGQFGAGQTLDIYYAAFRIPDLVYNILIIGAVSSAFIPVFHEYLTKDKDEAWKFSGNALNVLLIALIALSGVLIILAPVLVYLIAPGFDETARALTVNISRILFLSPLLLGISALAAALLQAFSRFLITSLAPIFYNLGIIFGIIFLVPQYGIWGLAYGVVIGAFLHFLVQVPALFTVGFKFYKGLNFKETGLIKVAKLWLPRTFSLMAFQIQSIVTTAIASFLVSGSITIYNFADNLRWVPIGIVGVAFSTAAFPAMSLAYAQGKKELFLKRFSLAVRQALFIVFPFSLMFFVLRNEIVRIILGTGQFGAQDVRLTAAVLGIFAFGIFAGSLLLLFTRAFFAFHNTRTPVFINIFSALISIFLAVVFSLFFSKYTDISAILGLPLAVTVSSIINLAWHWIDLKKHVGDFGIGEIKKSAAKILAASAVAAITAYAGLFVFSAFFNTGNFYGLFAQTIFSGLAAGAAYLVMAFFLRCGELSIFNFMAKPEPIPGESLDDQY